MILAMVTGRDPRCPLPPTLALRLGGGREGWGDEFRDFYEMFRFPVCQGDPKTRSSKAPVSPGSNKQ